jgi:tetratricopeptide (TPR) repeat protein
VLSALLAAVLLASTAGALPPAQTSPDPASGPPWSAAVESARAGRYDEAIARSTQLLEREPAQLTSRLIRAMSYYFTAQPGLALEDLDYALGRVGDDPSGRTLRALVHAELGNYDEAKADALQALTLPNLPLENVGAAHLVIARVLLAQGQFAEAADYFRAVQGLPDPVNARAGRIGLELLAALPAPGAALPPLRDAGDGFQTFELPNRQIRFQSANGISAAAAVSVARLLDAQLEALGKVTGTPYNGTLQLILYKSEWDLEHALNGRYRGPGLSRALRQGVRTTSDGPWYQYVHISVSNLELLWDLTHEAVHLVQTAAGLDDVFAVAPAWLVEGHAEHTAALLLRDSAPASTRFRLGHRGNAVTEAIPKEALLNLRGLERFADWSRAQNRDAELVYGQAYYAAALIAERYGAGTALAVLRAEQTGQDLETAFRTATGTTAGDFYADALEYTRRRAPVDAAAASDDLARRAVP